MTPSKLFQLALTPPLWCMARVVDAVDWAVWQADQVIERVS